MVGPQLLMLLVAWVYVGSSKMELAAKFTPKSVGGLVGVLGSLTAPYSIQIEIQIEIKLKYKCKYKYKQE